jgi:hypothetical protein
MRLSPIDFQPALRALSPGDENACQKAIFKRQIGTNALQTENRREDHETQFDRVFGRGERREKR